MPDVFTHLMVGASIALLVRRDDNRKEQMLVVLGAVLIDIERPISWMLAGTELEWIGLGSAFHSILGVVVLSYIAAACFVLGSTDFRNRVILIFIGCASHLLLDLIMYPWVEVGLYLLYPLKIPFSFNLLWPDFLWFPLIGITSLFGSSIIRYVIKFSSTSFTKSENDL
jgi:hypothetical protein